MPGGVTSGNDPPVKLPSDPRVASENDPPVKLPFAPGITFGNTTNFTINFHFGQ